MENINNLISCFQYVEKDIINNILDAGSGRSSLIALTDYFKNSTIDAIIYPGDIRKRESIKLNVLNNNYNLIELDICKSNITKEYDLVLSHLLLGEATTWNNSYQDLCNKLFSIKSKYYIIYDYKEDPTVDFKYLDNYIINNNMNTIKKLDIAKYEPQQFSNFLGKTYAIYIIQKEI